MENYRARHNMDFGHGIQPHKMGGPRGNFVVNSIVEPVDSILDVGCSYGWTLASLEGQARELVGVDVDAPALEQAQRNYPHIRFVLQTAAVLPFGSNEFDVVVLSEVIEHVGDENKQPVIDEIFRVLKPGGLLVFSSPHAGLFAWADPMDFKRRFPWIYRAYMRLTRYRPETPVEVGHKHLSFREIDALLDSRFDIFYVRYCGLFSPLFTWVLSIDARLRLLPKKWHSALNRARAAESGAQVPAFLADSIRLLARKKNIPETAPGGAIEASLHRDEF